MWRHEDKNATGMSRHHVTHNFLKVHSTLCSGRGQTGEGQWFKADWTTATNEKRVITLTHEYNLRPTLSSRGEEEEEGPVQETSEHCGEGLLTALKAAQHAAGVTPAKMSLPAVPPLPLSHS